MAKTVGNILLVDDDDLVLLSLKLLLESHFTSVRTLNNPERIPALLRQETFDVVVLDMNFRNGDTSGTQGRYWLKQILSHSGETQVILLTAYGDIEGAVESIKEGALDFIVKPWQNEKLLSTIKAAYLLSQEKKKVRHLKVQQRSIVSALESKGDVLIGESEQMKAIGNTISKIAPTDASVLILGPHGAGKEVIARQIHQYSQRAEGIFMSVDVGALSESLFEAEMFGYRKGAFTDAREDRVGRFEAAAGGTLFLDEIGNLSLPLQAKLLTALQHKRIVPLGTHQSVDLNVRIICATNSDLHALAKEGKFRQDLLYRINTVEIVIPPLHERAEDILPLVNHYLRKFSVKYEKYDLVLSEDARIYLQQNHWPGNVRELQHAVELAVIMCDNKVLTRDDFGVAPGNANDFQFDHFNLEKLEAWAIRKAIAKHGGNITHAAEELGLSRGALYRRMEAYGI